jgi:flagellar protein FliO/FliZ
MKSIQVKIAFIAILNMTYTPYLWAQELSAGASLGSYSWEAIKVIMSLAIVLIIFYLLVNAFKKYTGVSIKTNSSIRVLGGLTLGGKEKVVILEAGNVNFLLGVSSAGITKLHQFGDDELDSKDDSRGKPISFNQQIEKILGKKSS